MTLIVLGGINVTGKFVLGTEYTVQVDKKTTLKMVVRDVEGYDNQVVLEDLETGCTVFVYRETGEYFATGKVTRLAEGDFDEVMREYNNVTSNLIKAYKQSLK